jgi:ABC-type nitrate/sulfonate/bicarbonate transport system substrate-binding protein
MSKTTAVAGVIFIILILGGVYAFSQSLFDTTELTPVSVRFNWLHQSQFTGFYVAEEKGFYAEEGLDVTLNEFDFNVDQGQELATGGVDFSVMSAQELISFIDRGNALKAIAVVYQISPYAFASLSETNIKTPNDLRGKTLGLAGGNLQAKVTYQALLNQFDIKPEEVVFKDLGFDTPQDVITREADIIDLYRTDQTFLLNELQASYNLLLPEQFDFGIYGDVITANTELIEKDPELARKFVRATIKGWEYTFEHQDEAIEIVSMYANEQYQNKDHLTFIFEQSKALIQPTGRQNIGDMQYLKWKKAYDAMKAAGVVKSEMNVEDIFTFSILEE